MNVQPSFGFCVCHKPSIMALAHQQPQSFLGSIYNKSMVLEKMMPSIQEKYLEAWKEKHWTSLLYQYESVKAQLVNKMKILLPLIPAGLDQVVVIE